MYCAFDSTNGKVYVGQTIHSFEFRKKSHLDVNNSRNYCTKFKNALHKRPDKFSWSVLTEVDNQEDLNNAEIYWINFFDACGSGGYNLEYGGAHGKWSEEAKLALRKKLEDPEIRMKMKLAKLGTKQSPEHIAARMKGKKSFKLSEKTKSKLSEIACEQWKRRYAGDEHAIGSVKKCKTK